MQPVDSLISARWIIPIVPAGTILEHHTLVIHQGKILDILPTSEVAARYKSKRKSQLDNHVLLPGFINAHTHAAMNLLRGYADDLPLKEWLEEHIWPAESKWISDEFVYDGTMLAMAEMIRGGTTCFHDMYFFSEAVARAVDEAGMRSVVGATIIDFPTAWGSNPDVYIQKALGLIQDYKHHSRIAISLAPHAPYTVSNDPLKHIVTLANEFNTPIHMHIHETEHEVNEAISNDNQRPLARLDDHGLLDCHLMAVHMTCLNDEEIALLAKKNVHVIHCPESNLKLASGFCPVSKLLDAGVNVAIGTDGAASNNNLDMFEEMHLAAILAKGVSGNSTSVNAQTALEMATINGAKALGIDEVTGSLEVGKAADLIAVEANNLHCAPMYNLFSHLVYVLGKECVSDVWIEGKQLLKNQQLTSLKQDDLYNTACTWQQKIG